MNRAVLVCTLCAALSGSLLENVDAQLSKGHGSWSIIQSMETLSKVVEGLQSEMKVAFQNLEAKVAMQGNSLSNLQVTVDELKTLLIKSREKEEENLASLSNLKAGSNNHTIMINRVGEHLENQTSLMNHFFTKQEMQINNLTNIEAKVTTVSDVVKTLAHTIKSTAPKVFVEGIIAGTEKGVVIIPLDSLEQRTISSKDTCGVAFNWQTRKVYWNEDNVGIKIADLDGSHEELLIPNASLLCGLAVDQITGNFYYGERGSNASIRVCNSMGKRCATVTSRVNNVGEHIYDIALLPSEGLMFWSSPYDKKVVTRANMDGTNATIIISEDVYGLDLDEVTETLYWTNYYGKSIGHHDLNGYNRNVLLNNTTSLYGIAVDADKLYFGGYNRNGVYSVTSNRQITTIAKSTGRVYHIALFGGNKVSSRANPCNNSPCANLCVLNRASFTCL